MLLLELKLCNENSLLAPALALVDSLAQAEDFDVRSAGHLRLVTEEILTNLLKYQFLPDQRETINIRFERTTLGLSVEFHTSGLPMNVEAIQRASELPLDEILDGEARGLGQRLIHALTDGVSFENRGRDGQCIRFFKHREHALVEAPAVDVETKPPKGGAQAPFRIRRMKPEEAAEISRLAYMAYRMSYIYDQIYYPDRVRSLNASDEMRSYVAEHADSGEILGHCALLPDKLARMDELAVAFVNPKFRGGGCLNDLSKHLLQVCRDQKLEGALANAVTVHPYSQKAVLSLGLKETALFVSRLTPLSMSGIKAENTLRESLLLMVLPFERRRSVEVNAPLHHRRMIQRIYSELGWSETRFPEPSPPSPPSSEPCRISTESDPYRCTHIFVHAYGSDVLDQVSRSTRASCLDRIETIYLYLPLDLPETAHACAQLEKTGFFFGGVRPGKDGRDWLLLQLLNNQRYDYSALTFASPLGRELIDYIRSLDPDRVG